MNNAAKIGIKKVSRLRDETLFKSETENTEGLSTPRLMCVKTFAVFGNLSNLKHTELRTRPQ
jgi:hypothetical protein